MMMGRRKKNERKIMRDIRIKEGIRTRKRRGRTEMEKRL